MKKKVLIMTGIILLMQVKGLGISQILTSSAMQNASLGLVLMGNSPSGTAYNPAYLEPGMEAGGTYLFSMSELPIYNLHLAFTRNQVGFYNALVHFNHPLHRETMVNLAVNYSGKEYAAGAGLRLLTSNTTGYDGSNKLMADFGMIREYRRFIAGFSLKNITAAKIDGEMLPLQFISEVNYRFDGNGSISIGLEKELKHDYVWKIAGSYKLQESLLLVTGYQYQPARIGAGLFFTMNRMRIGYSMQTHQHLPLTHYVGVGYELAQPRDKFAAGE